ncbi:hypothetical protein TSOC_012929 [Tetrabaena socialis]|uniref:PARP catalytic domain-containing protein n=1 Tax=Tetrabaena socialis TaxID=47790 RepID=A0A2J7ZLQ3_9CHLO|nr:hypothetical protein TSOC_012929 [Tetrabaena socialis]|eukprot:PNH01199.1 hypothetical protein TSOC_012929 [Tetrabaena socialis]
MYGSTLVPCVVGDLPSRVIGAVHGAGRVISAAFRVDNPRLRQRFEKAKHALAQKKEVAGKIHVHHTMYHTTRDMAAAKSIAESGFKVGHDRNRAAFGFGVNLARDFGATIHFGAARGKTVTLVCTAAVGRSHDNPTEHPDNPITIPKYMRPRKGYDAMTGMGGYFTVISASSRVLPMYVVIHEPEPGTRPAPASPHAGAKYIFWSY